MHNLLLPSFASATLRGSACHEPAPYMLDAERAEAEAKAAARCLPQGRSNRLLSLMVLWLSPLRRRAGGPVPH